MIKPGTYSLNLGGELLSLQTPAVMGILNITPDSFYKASRSFGETDILHRAERMLDEGADILDIGGYSTRPGADEIPYEEEERRVLTAIKSVLRAFPEAKISVDTFRASVAKAAVNEGALLVNDVSGGSLDPEMFSTVAELKVPYVLMHMRGTPKTMKNLNIYEDLSRDVLFDLQAKVTELRNLGVSDIILDPGFGFSKNITQNFELLNKLDFFKTAGCPLLVGLSRKSVIYKTLGTEPADALNGTTVLNTLALERGADILRVHDVREAKEAITLTQAFQSAAENS